MEKIILKELNKLVYNVETQAGDKLHVIDTSDFPEIIIKVVEELTKTALAESNDSGSLRFSERDVDFAYLCGVFNVSGIDGLHKEIQRFKEIGKEPHNIIDACRNQVPITTNHQQA